MLLIDVRSTSASAAEFILHRLKLCLAGRHHHHHSVSFVFLALFTSAVLFFAAGNPMTGTKTERNANPLVYASCSWWVNFIGARQLCTLVLSRFTEILMVGGVLTLRTRTVLKMFGPLVSLLVMQARGWPHIVTFWAVWNFAFLQSGKALAC